MITAGRLVDLRGPPELPHRHDEHIPVEATLAEITHQGRDRLIVAPALAAHRFLDVFVIIPARDTHGDEHDPVLDEAPREEHALSDGVPPVDFADLGILLVDVKGPAGTIAGEHLEGFVGERVHRQHCPRRVAEVSGLVEVCQKRLTIGEPLGGQPPCKADVRHREGGLVGIIDGLVRRESRAEPGSATEPHPPRDCDERRQAGPVPATEMSRHRPHARHLVLPALVVAQGPAGLRQVGAGLVAPRVVGD